MDIKDFDKMSLSEIQEFQKKNKAKMDKNRARIKEQKARTHRLITRGALVEDFIPGASTMTDDEFIQKLYELIYKK